MTVEFSREFAKANNGKRPDFFDEAQIPQGWVVNGELDDENWVYIKGEIIPILPAEIDKLITSKPLFNLKQAARKYGGDVFAIVFRDDKVDKKYSAGYVLSSDLKKTPEILVQEFKELTERRDYFQANMKRNAYYAISGKTDLGFF